jgi:hypothetical protein
LSYVAALARSKGQVDPLDRAQTRPDLPPRSRQYRQSKYVLEHIFPPSDDAPRLVDRGDGLVDLRETFPLPWRYVPLPFDGGGFTRFAYLIVAANDVESHP